MLKKVVKDIANVKKKVTKPKRGRKKKGVLLNKAIKETHVHKNKSRSPMHQRSKQRYLLSIDANIIRLPNKFS